MGCKPPGIQVRTSGNSIEKPKSIFPIFPIFPIIIIIIIIIIINDDSSFPSSHRNMIKTFFHLDT